MNGMSGKLILGGVAGTAAMTMMMMLIAPMMVSFRQGCEVCLCESEAVAEG